MVDNGCTHDDQADYAQYAPSEDFELQSKLKTFYYELDGVRDVVAATSVSAAFKILGMTRFRFLRNGGETSRTEEIEMALSDPGAVFRRDGSGEWKKVKSSAIAAKLPRHGGSRTGAGAPLVAGAPMKLHTFYCTDEQWEALSQLAGPAGVSVCLRRLIDEEITKKQKNVASEPSQLEQK